MLSNIQISYFLNCEDGDYGCFFFRENIEAPGSV